MLAATSLVQTAIELYQEGTAWADIQLELKLAGQIPRHLPLVVQNLNYRVNMACPTIQGSRHAPKQTEAYLFLIHSLLLSILFYANVLTWVSPS